MLIPLFSRFQLIEDIGGNCFLSNPKAPAKDPNAKVSLFVRTKEQDHRLGIYTRDELEDDSTEGVLKPPEEKLTLESLQSEVFQLPANCSSCNAPCEVNTKVTSKFGSCKCSRAVNERTPGSFSVSLQLFLTLRRY